MKNNTILIIGNGSSVAKKEFGAYIDKYEKIARINNYKIHGYEKHIGTKTDIWINGANSKLIKRKKYPEEVLVLIPSKISGSLSCPVSFLKVSLFKLSILMLIPFKPASCNCFAILSKR